jgi:DNA mismatch repair protein MutL
VVKLNDSGDIFSSISDDSMGIDETAVAMVFERNATSKLATIKDLEPIATFWSRGEAIASIGSVAPVTMQTNDGNDGTEIDYDFEIMRISLCRNGSSYRARFRSRRSRQRPLTNFGDAN